MNQNLKQKNKNPEVSKKMILRILMAAVFCLVLNAGAAFPEQEKPSDMNAAITMIMEASMGKGIKIIRIEKAEETHIKGLKQVRIWLETRYGETPVLSYVSDDGRFFLAGSIFDAEGNNLTKKDVGMTKPRFISESDMELNEDYRIGPKDAKAKVVLWVGLDAYSKLVFDTFYELYRKNSETMALYLKFYPRSEKDIDKMILLTCEKSERAMELFRMLLDVPSGWGSKEDIDAFKEKQGLKDKECNKDLIRKDLELSIKFLLPQEPRAFVNGTIFLEEPTAENVSRISGIELK